MNRILKQIRQSCMLDPEVQQLRRDSIKRGATPVLRETDLSYEAKYHLNRLGYEANTSIMDIPRGFSDYVEKEVPGRIAHEITDYISEFLSRRITTDGYESP